MGPMMTSGSLGSVIVSTLAWDARNVGSILTPGTIFHIFITPMTLVVMTMILYRV